MQHRFYFKFIFKANLKVSDVINRVNFFVKFIPKQTILYSEKEIIFFQEIILSKYLVYIYIYIYIHVMNWVTLISVFGAVADN